MEVDYIIVGFGLAGFSFSDELERHNKSFVVFENNSQISSLVAGGTYNPLVLKRFTPVWNGDSQLKYAETFYTNLEQKFNEKYDTKVLTKKLFSSVGDENNWFIACDKPIVSKYLNPKIYRDKIEGVITDFGYGELSGTGWIDIKKMLSAYKLQLEKQDVFFKETFEYDQIIFEDDFVKYKDITAKKIVFAEGYGVKDNPYFNHLPLNGTKGEVITIFAPELDIDFQLKSAVFVLPLGNYHYKVGATFNWTDKTSIPTEEGKNELVEKLKKFITVPFEVVEQSAGIRPTVKDRRPLVGVHQKYKNIAILNGLGTRGVMIAPTVAKALFNHLEHNEPLDKEIDILRFIS